MLVFYSDRTKMDKHLKSLIKLFARGCWGCVNILINIRKVRCEGGVKYRNYLTHFTKCPKGNESFTMNLFKSNTLDKMINVQLTQRFTENSFNYYNILRFI